MPKRKDKPSKERAREVTSATQPSLQRHVLTAFRHCQPSLDPAQLAICSSRQCPHCNDCTPCQTAADLKWRYELIWGPFLAAQKTTTRDHDEDSDDSELLITEYHAACDRIGDLEDENKLLLHQVASMEKELAEVRLQGKRSLLEDADADAEDDEMDDFSTIKQLKLEEHSQTGEVDRIGACEPAESDVSESESFRRIKRERSEDRISPFIERAEKSKVTVEVPPPRTAPRDFSGRPRPRTREQHPRAATLLIPVLTGFTPSARTRSC